jgi:hypothetical protein
MSYTSEYAQNEMSKSEKARGMAAKKKVIKKQAKYAGKAAKAQAKAESSTGRKGYAAAAKADKYGAKQKAAAVKVGEMTRK